MNRPTYTDLIIRHVLDSDRLRHPGVHHVEVLHGDDCARWRGEPCDCNPTVISGAPVDRKYGGPNAASR